MLRWVKHNPGHLASIAFMGVSAFLSGRGAWLGAEGGAFILLVVITAVSEPSKLLAYRVLLGMVRRAGVFNRLLALIWCGACIVAAGYLSRLPVAKELAEAEASGVKLQGVETALEDARSALVPGIRKSAVMRAELLKRLSREERIQFERELASAVSNEQLEGKIGRLETILKFAPERSRTFTKRPPGARVSGVPSVHEQVNALSLAAAILVEVGIVGGIWHDVLARRGEAPIPAPTTSAKPPSGRRKDGAKRFEQYLLREWKAKRAKDGWLEGTQDAWARACGVSKGFVYAQLDAMQKAGRIEKRADAKNTWIIFKKMGELKIAT